MGLSCTINVKIDEAGALILMLLVAMMADDSLVEVNQAI